MSYMIDIPRSAFFNELNEEQQKKYFDLKAKKYLHNIDTLYYSVFIKGDNNENEQVNILVDDLKSLKNDLLSIDDDGFDFLEDLELLKVGRHADYSLRLSLRDCYDIYFVHHIRNSNTPRILVQIRSSYLWRLGAEQSLYDSLDKVSKVLSHYKLEIDRTQENRIDFAYHSNIIQNPKKYFSTDKLCNIYKGSLKQFNMIGLLDTNNNDYTIDYLALGSPKSNNVFFRIYDKTREVVELGYKSFFFDLWYKEGLINFYDKYCLEYCYINKSNYDKRYEASLHFYLEYGHNELIKFEINHLLLNKNTTFEEIKSFSSALMPPVTKILNFEFETKRKYYYYYNEVIDVLSCNSENDKLNRVFKIIDNRKIFLDMLTDRVVSFQKNGKILPFWNKLRTLKIKSISKDKIKASYSSDLDIKKIENTIVNNLVSLSLYKSKNNIDSDVIHDLVDLLVDLNDNDVSFDSFNELTLVSRETGECLNIHNSKAKDLYKEKKQKKYKQIKNRLN